MKPYDFFDTKVNSVTMLNRICSILFTVGLFFSGVAYCAQWSSDTTEVSSSLWPATNAIDGKSETNWSSQVKSDRTSAEQIAFWFTEHVIHEVNYLRILPRYVNNVAAGFPVKFTAFYSSKTDRVSIYTWTNFPSPNRGDVLILPFPSTISCDGILIRAEILGTDIVGNYVFQLAEVSAGYEDDFSTVFQFQGNDSSLTLQNEIRQVGSRNFDPGKLSVWHNDVRRPLIAPGAGQNIYAPTVVENGSGNWNIYFGGWDHTRINDEVSIANSPDNFLTYGNHISMVTHGEFLHVNNCSAIKVSDQSWKMICTAYPVATKNKPILFSGTNGIDWSPNSGTSGSLIKMTGYDGWENADVNGGNVLYFENGLYHLFFNNFSVNPIGVFHATSNDCINFQYQGNVQPVNRVPNDLKSFEFNNSKVYVLATHVNTGNIHLSLSSSLTSFTDAPIVLESRGEDDKYIVAPGLVSDGKRLLGVLYGACAVNTLNFNRIFARWLQLKVIFKNKYVQWGDIEEAYGPDRIRMYQNSSIETGEFYIYDSDGATLLYTSPTVTMRSGDIWKLLTIPRPVKTFEQEYKLPVRRSNLYLHADGRNVVVSGNVSSSGVITQYDIKGAVVSMTRFSAQRPVVNIKGATGPYMFKVVSGNFTTWQRLFLVN